jgi:hypothetical protein
MTQEFISQVFNEIAFLGRLAECDRFTIPSIINLLETCLSRLRYAQRKRDRQVSSL